VTSDEMAGKSAPQLPLPALRPLWTRYAFAVALAGLACALGEVLTPASVTSNVPYLFFWPVVVLASWYGRWGPGVVAVVLSALLADWFFIEPRHALGLKTVHDVCEYFAFVGTGALVVLVIERSHRANIRARLAIREWESLAANLEKLVAERTSQSEEKANRLAEAETLASLRRWDWDIEDGTGQWSDELYRIFGVPQGEFQVSFESILERVHPEDRQRVRSTAEEAARTGQRLDYVHRIVRPDGTVRTVHSRGQSVRDASGRILRMFGTSQDVTETERLAGLNADLERRVRERTQQLQETVHDLQSFSYTVAHDLRAPLRAMRGFADLVLEDAESRLEPVEREYLTRITQSANRMDNLVGDLLSYSRLGLVGVQPETVDLEAMVREALWYMSSELAACKAETTVEAGIPKVFAQRAILFEVVTNLISNAAKFVAPGVRPRIRIAAQTRGDRVRLIVEDNGIGIDPRYHAKLFGIFERLHVADAYPGTGIGLAIVKRSIERMGGQVGVDSELGRGSLFWF